MTTCERIKQTNMASLVVVDPTPTQITTVNGDGGGDVLILTKVMIIITNEGQ